LILVGTCSWTDKTLLACGRFYPASARSAEQRLRYYAEHFDTVEVDSSYYHLPAERNSWLWIERTPAHFIFNIKAYRSLTLHERGRKPEQLEWQMFESAILPLAEAGKLGYVLFQFPPWFIYSEENKEYILECQQRLPRFRLAIQFRHASWLSDREQARETLQWLKEHDLPYVGVDEPQYASRRTIPPIAVPTAKDLSVVRFNGRNLHNWFAKNIPVYERFHYRYSEQELAEWVPRILELTNKSQLVFIMFNNCFEDDAIVNAKEIVRQLRAAAGQEIAVGGSDRQQEE
jgi:uncharacterized protein YecE (DUF72 family)